jgi:hypothetical protein
VRLTHGHTSGALVTSRRVVDSTADSDPERPHGARKAE